MPRNLTIIFVIIGLCTLTFFLGYRFGYRETYNDSPSNIDYIQNDYGNLNALTKIKLKSVQGPQNSGDEFNFNRGYVILNENKNTTDIKILLRNIPQNVSLNEDKKNNIPSQQIKFPTKLKIEAASTNLNIRSLNFTQISELTLNPPDKNNYTGDLSFTVNNKDIRMSDVSFLFFYDASNSIQNLYEIDLKDYPNLDVSKKRPFLWVVLQ